MTKTQTLFSSYIHIVFSTKNRFNFITPDIEDELYAYIGGVLRNFKRVLLKAGGTANQKCEGYIRSTIWNSTRSLFGAEFR